MQTFTRRVSDMPTLGLGVSTEYGASANGGALDVFALQQQQPSWVQFLEVGVEVARGLDASAARWVSDKRANTYHFLDINLDDVRDFDRAWLDGVSALCAQMQPAWLCGDAGLWHFGARDRGQMLLLPPVLTDEAATDLATGVAMLREAAAREVLPENPPGSAFVGDLHMLDFFGRVCARGDSGMLLDVAHLAMFQHARGLPALAGFDAFDYSRVVEVHVAGGVHVTVDGYTCIEDAHGVDVLDDTWRIFEHVVGRAVNLRAVVFECERNSIGAVGPGFERITQTLQGAASTALRERVHGPP